MKRVVNFSGGACSFWAAHRVIEKYGSGEVVLLFADTLIESPDLYEFNDWTSKYFGIPITRVSREMKPWDLFRKEGFIANSRSPICSIRLKRQPLDEWCRENMQPVGSLFGEADIAYVGLDWNEQHRLDSLRLKKPQWQWVAPMLEWKPIWDKPRMITELEKIKAPIPRAYREGFPHNNCNRRCVQAGISHWMRLYDVDKPAFYDWMAEEQLTIEDLALRGIKALPMLKYQRNKVPISMTLKDLEKRILANDPTLPKYEWGGCGCSVEE